MQNLVDAQKNLTKEQKLAFAQKLVGAESAKYLMTLMTQNDVIQKLSDNQYIQGNASKQAEERAQSLTASITAMTNKFTNLITVGTESTGALSVFGGVIRFITDHMEA